MRVLAVSAVLLLVMAGCMAAEKEVPEEAEPPVSPVPLDADGFAAQLSTGWTYEDMSFQSPLADFPVQLEVYLPDPATTVDGMELPAKFPTVLMASPYWGDGVGPELDFGGYVAYEGLTHRLIQRGYAVVMGDSASMGGSGGCWDFMGPVDVAGVLALVDAIVSQPWSDGRVGMHGLSYDGMTQIMAASHQAEGLVTVVPAAALTHAYAGLYQGGVHYGGGWHTTTAVYTQSSLAPRTNQARQGGWLDSVASTPECADTNAMANDPTGSYNDYFQARDFRPLGKQINTSVFVLQGLFDAAVKPDNFGEWFANVPTAKKAWLGWWVHTYPSAHAAGREDLLLVLQSWFDHELKGIPNGVLDGPVIDVMDSQGRWRHEDAWPPADARSWGLNLSADGSLKPSGAAPGTVAVGAPTDVQGVLTESSATTFTWSGDEDVRIVGVPTLDVRVASDRAGGYLIARLLDVHDGGVQLVSRGALNLNVRADGPGGLMVPGDPIDVTLELYPTDYHLLAGRELVLELKTQDDTGWYDPDAQQAILTLHTGDGVSTLSLPTVERDAEPFLVACGVYLEPYVDDCYDEDRKDQGVPE